MSEDYGVVIPPESLPTHADDLARLQDQVADLHDALAAHEENGKRARKVLASISAALTGGPEPDETVDLSNLTHDVGKVLGELRLTVDALETYAKARTLRIGQLERLAASQQAALARHAEQRRAAAEYTAQVVRERDAARSEVERLTRMLEVTTTLKDRYGDDLATVRAELAAAQAEIERLRGLVRRAAVDGYRAGLRVAENPVTLANAEQWADVWLLREAAQK